LGYREVYSARVWGLGRCCRFGNQGRGETCSKHFYRVFNRLPKMLSQDSDNDTQQDKSDKAPKYPSPRLMPAAVDRRFFGFLTHQVTANSIFR
jgi:hypothetical protein